MGSLNSQEQAAVERAMASQEVMFDRTRDWAAINSGSRNLEGLAAVGDKLMEAVSSLPGVATYRDPARVEAESPTSGTASTATSSDISRTISAFAEDDSVPSSEASSGFARVGVGARRGMVPRMTAWFRKKAGRHH